MAYGSSQILPNFCFYGYIGAVDLLTKNLRIIIHRTPSLTSLEKEGPHTNLKRRMVTLSAKCLENNHGFQNGQELSFPPHFWQTEKAFLLDVAKMTVLKQENETKKNPIFFLPS